MKNELSFLLKKISLHKERHDIIREKEEKFNIFSVLHKENDERRLHSRFISTLMNPIATHGVNNLFLFNFIKLFDDIKESSFRNAVIYPSEHEKKEYENIDIFIIDRKTESAIIIENKIYAGDSNNESGGQLERYFDHVLNKEKIPENNIKVFYLTLDGHLPSKESLGKYNNLERINGRTISYDIHILEWLDESIKEVYDKPFLRESIIQYINLIKKMNNNVTNIEERKELKELIANNEEAMSATKYLIDNFKHIKWHAISDFWEEISQELENRNYIITKNIDVKSITALTHNPLNNKEEEDGIEFMINETLKCFIRHEKNDWLFWGFDKATNNSNKLLLEELFEQKIIIESLNSKYWYNYFKCSDNKKIKIKDFSDQRIFNLIDPNRRKQMVISLVDSINHFNKKHLRKNSR